MLHYHGTPITPREVLLQLAGRCFCISYADPRDVEVCHEIGQSCMLDNGAFSFWRKRKPTDWTGYYQWCERWLEYPTTWAVIPDVIDGSVEDNDQLLREWFQTRLPKGAPVWHMHEPLDRLRRLCAGYEKVCIGSSGEYATLKTAQWHRRMEAAMNAVCADRTPWLHMLRGMGLSGGHYPFASVDSTDIARNHAGNNTRGTPAKDAVKMASRWDAMQCPPRWTYREQLSLV